MQIAGVIAEYNPFHNGHAYHLRQTKMLGADAVVAVMSGDFVQRGTPAILSKYARAESAVQCGVDLVLELPLPWAIGRAQTFAEGAILTLSCLGCADMLSFGSECGDVSLLRQTATDLRHSNTVELTKQYLSCGNLTFAAARQKAVSDLYGDRTANVLRDPNDTLAVEYMLAAERYNVGLQFLAVPRIGRHDGINTDDALPSASQIRQQLYSGKPIFGCPSETERIWNQYAAGGSAPADLEKMERAILADWRTVSAEELSFLPDVSEGLERRMQDAARNATTLAEYYELAKTKRYTHARIRRIVLARFLGLNRQEKPENISYLRVLAIGKNGKEILRTAQSTCSVPILTRSADQRSLDTTCSKMLQLEQRAGELYGLLLPKVSVAGEEMRKKIYIAE